MRIFTETVFKEDVSEPLGLGVAIEDKTRVKLAALAAQTKFSSRVNTGLYIIKINSDSVNGWTEEQVIGHLKSLEGPITFLFCDKVLSSGHLSVVRFSTSLFQEQTEEEDGEDEILMSRSTMTEALLSKSFSTTTPTTPVSLGLKLATPKNNNGIVIIDEIEESSPLVATLGEELKPGVGILAINDMSCFGLSPETVLGNLEAHCMGKKETKEVELILGVYVSLKPGLDAVPLVAKKTKVWGKYVYPGSKTNIVGLLGCLAGGLPGLFICCCCHLDQMDAYVDSATGDVYDAAGGYIGPWEDHGNAFIAATPTTYRPLD